MVKTASFCRHIEKDWLEQSLRWTANGATPAQLNSNIENFLSVYIATKENRRKARNLLTSIWMSPSDENSRSFFEKSITLHKKADSFSLPIHWGMLIAKKPFFAEVARFIGRQTRLNDSFTFAQAYRRMSMLYGETESTSRALRAVLRTMIELEVLIRDPQASSYQIANMREPVCEKIANWLLNALFISTSSESMNLEDALNDQSFFPFIINLNAHNLDMSQFEQLQQGSSVIVFKKRYSA